MDVILVDQVNVLIDGTDIDGLKDSFTIAKNKLKQQENGDFIISNRARKSKWLLTQDKISPALVTMQICIGDSYK